MTFEGHPGNVLAVVTWCAQLTRDVFAITKFLVHSPFSTYCICSAAIWLSCIFFLPRDAMRSADRAVARCLSVRLSVVRRYSVETAKHILRIFSPSVAIHHTNFSIPNVMATFRLDQPPNAGIECRDI